MENLHDYYANIRFDFNDDVNLYVFNLPDNLKTVWLREDELMLVDTKFGKRVGYFSLYHDPKDIDCITPTKSIISREDHASACVLPYELSDNFNILTGFIIVNVGDKHVKYAFKNNGLVGIINHMLTNNISSAFICSTQREFDPLEMTTYYHINIGDSPNADDNYLYSFADNNATLYISFNEVSENDIETIYSCARRDEIIGTDTNAVQVAEKQLEYRTELLRNLDNRMIESSDELRNYASAIRDSNKVLPAGSVFGYFIDYNLNSQANIFEFRESSKLGVYNAYYIMQYKIDPGMFGKGRYWDYDDDEYDYQGEEDDYYDDYEEMEDDDIAEVEEDE